MKQIPSGQFFGRTNETIRLDGLTLTDTEYLHDRVDWHYHENPYFTFLLQGGLMEGTRRGVHECGPGSLLFHNWQEPHYNMKPPGLSRGFHVEVDASWLDAFDMDLGVLQGDLRIDDPDIKFLFHKIHRETMFAGPDMDLGIGSLLLQALSVMTGMPADRSAKDPKWVSLLHALLHDLSTETPTLTELARVADIHPVHLSREFPRRFGCTLGTYLRKLKIEHALVLMLDPDRPLTDIAYASGFSDQSHFIRCFRGFFGMSPNAYRKYKAN